MGIVSTKMLSFTQPPTTKPSRWNTTAFLASPFILITVTIAPRLGLCRYVSILAKGLSISTVNTISQNWVCPKQDDRVILNVVRIRTRKQIFSITPRNPLHCNPQIWEKRGDNTKKVKIWRDNTVRSSWLRNTGVSYKIRTYTQADTGPPVSQIWPNSQ